MRRTVAYPALSLVAGLPRLAVLLYERGVALYALAAGGAAAMPRRFLVLAVALLACTTLAEMALAGATRYRIPWDFLLAIPAAAALVALADGVPRRETAEA